MVDVTQAVRAQVHLTCLATDNCVAPTPWDAVWYVLICGTTPGALPRSHEYQTMEHKRSQWLS